MPLPEKATKKKAVTDTEVIKANDLKGEARQKVLDGVPKIMKTSEMASDITTLMGNLGKRMAARDYIDKQNLGTQAIVTNDANEILIDDASMPRGINVIGVAKERKAGLKVEGEHKDTIKALQKKDTSLLEAKKKIVKDHLEEKPDYYTKLKTLQL